MPKQKQVEQQLAVVTKKLFLEWWLDFAAWFLRKDLKTNRHLHLIKICMNSMNMDPCQMDCTMVKKMIKHSSEYHGPCILFLPLTVSYIL